MTAFEAAVSVRLGEVRSADVIAQVGDADVVAVHALTVAGVPVTIELALVELWAGVAGWRRALACPLCSRPVRVLAVTEKGVGCALCIPRRTKQQLRKNAAAWVEERDVDKLVRHVLRGGGASEGFVTMARTVRRKGIQQLQSALDSAQHAVMAVDALKAALPAEPIDWCLDIPGADADDIQLEVEVPIGEQPSKRWQKLQAARAAAGSCKSSD